MSLASAGSPAAEAKLPATGGTQADGNEPREAGTNLLIYPYERLKVISKDPVAGIDITKREVPLLHSSGDNLIYSVCCILSFLPFVNAMTVTFVSRTAFFYVDFLYRLLNLFGYHATKSSRN